MDQELLDQVRYECLRLGNEVVSQYQQDATGCYWKTITVDRDSNRLKVAQPALYSGVCGISLFLLELYRVSSEPSYLAYAESGIAWAVRQFHTQQGEQFSLFAGKGGIVYALLKFEAITGKSGYLDVAVSMASSNQKFLSYCGDDIIGGAAGGALALLLLFERTKSLQFLHDAQTYADLIMQHMFVGPKGVYWERSPDNIAGLCGLAHGCSGIALPFLELFAVTGKDEYLWVAEQAFRYEDDQMKRIGRSWPDLRKGRFRPEDFENHEQAFRRGDKAYFTQPNEFDMWCHGAAGIGFARLRAFELTGKPEHLESSRRAVSITATAESQPGKTWQTYTLCHGRFGNAALLRAWDRVHASKTYENTVSSVVRDALNSRSNMNGYLSGYGGMGGPNDMSEASLMMGLSGIGIFYASLLSDSSALDFLAPFLRSGVRSEEAREPVNPVQMIKTKYFPKTSALLKSKPEPFIPGPLQAEDIALDFVRSVKDSSATGERNEELDFELQKFTFDKEISSFVFTELSWEYILKRNSEVQNELEAVTLCLNPNIKLCSKKDGASSTSIVLIRRGLATGEMPLATFASMMLSVFDKPRDLQTAIEAIVSQIGESIDSNLVRQMALAQIKEALNSGFIIDCRELSLLEQP